MKPLGVPSGLDPGGAAHYLCIACKSAALGKLHISGNCAEGKGSSWNAEPFPPHGVGHASQCVLIPKLGTPRYHRGKISFPGLSWLSVNGSPFALPRAPLVVNASSSSIFIYLENL